MKLWIFLGLVLCQLWGQAGHAITFDLAQGNWAGDASTKGGIDAGMPGDAQALVVSADHDMNYPESIETKVKLEKALDGNADLNLEIGYRANPMQTTRGRLYWDGVLVKELNAQTKPDGLRLDTVALKPLKLNLAAGEHVVKIEALPTENTWDFFQVDSLRIQTPAEGSLTGGSSMLYEIFPLEQGNYPGDGTTWGGLDQGAAEKADHAGQMVSVAAETGVGSGSLELNLTQEFKGRVRVTAAVYRNANVVGQASMALNGQPVLKCDPFIPATKLEPGESRLENYSACIELANPLKGACTVHFDLKRGTEPGAGRNFIVDAIMIEQLPAMPARTRVPLGRTELVLGAKASEQERIAAEKLRDEITSLTHVAPSLVNAPSGEAETSLLLGSEMAGEPEKADLTQRAGVLKDWQREEAYAVSITTESGHTRISAHGMGHMGSVYAMAELQTRLRQDERGGWYLEFPVASTPGPVVFEYPRARSRGEYVNIGYNLPGITPHEWDRGRWEWYLDQLVLARLNTFYFYIWTDVYSMYPGSELSKTALSRNIHEGLSHAIDYAHRRGLKVVFMATPAYAPRDVWNQHPEMHAEIEYVDHGFPAVCLNAPGAWERMKTIWRSEFEWFAKADALHIWFYDPGGCWCTKNGCREHQAETLARELREYGAMFRELNPKAELEFNIWPIWLWETRMGKYREATIERIKAAFPQEYGEIRAAGAPDNEDTLPLPERKAGFDTSVFLFGSNPENSYFFLIPNLTFHEETMRRVVQKYGFDRLFGHRLEVVSRMPATHFMAAWMWNPDLSRDEAVERWAGWATTQTETQLELKELVFLLEQFTRGGADPQIGIRMRQLMAVIYPKLNAARQKEFEYLPAMFEGLNLLAQGMNLTSNSAKLELADQFEAALQSSKLFAPSTPMSHRFFESYSKLLNPQTGGGQF